MTLCFLLDLPAVHIQQCEEAGEAQRCPVHVEQPHGEYSDTRKTSLEAAYGSLRHFQELNYSQCRGRIILGSVASCIQIQTDLVNCLTLGDVFLAFCCPRYICTY